MVSSREPASKTTSCSRPQASKVAFPSFRTVHGMISFCTPLELSQSSPITSSPSGKRSTLGSFWLSPSCSLVLYICRGRHRSVTPVHNKQSQPSSWMSSFSSSLFIARHSLNATAPILLNEGGAVKDSMPEP